MTNVDHVHGNRSRQISRKATNRHVIEIVPNRASLAVLDKRFRGSSTKCGERLCSVPGHGLFLTACPVTYSTDDFKHLAQTSLRLSGPSPLSPIERFPSQSSRLGKLALGHAKSLSNLRNRNLTEPIHIGQDQRLILCGCFECLSHIDL